MEAPWVFALVLLGLWMLTSGILLTVVYMRGRRIQELEEENCTLVQAAARAVRAVRHAKYVARIEGMSHEEMAREFDRLYSNLIASERIGD